MTAQIMRRIDAWEIHPWYTEYTAEYGRHSVCNYKEMRKILHDLTETPWLVLPAMAARVGEPSLR